jgi:hypothetical protein
MLRFIPTAMLGYENHHNLENIVSGKDIPEAD